MRQTQVAHPHASRRFPALLMVLCVMVSGCVSAPAHASETGIQGTVLWGPVQPGPTRLGQTDEAPLSASFTVYGPENAVARFRSDEKGNFEVSLPPGDYTIVPNKDTPIPYPGKQKTKVTVPEDGYAVVTIRLDTGMK